MKRTDGKQNREALIKAAQEVFALKGFDVPLEDIAKAAGVSRTTLYRNFEDRYALGIALFESQRDDFSSVIQDIGDDPKGLLFVLDAIAEGYCRNMAIAEVLSSREALHPRLEELRQGLFESLMPLLRNGQEAEVIRKEIVPADIDLVMDAIFSIRKRATAAEHYAASKRLLNILKAGLCVHVTSNDDK